MNKFLLSKNFLHQKHLFIKNLNIFASQNKFINCSNLFLNKTYFNSFFQKQKPSKL